MNLNMQPKEGLDHQVSSLDIVNVFPTIQGEGPFAGTPAVFVRLAGCNLSDLCRGCDTDYTSNRRRVSVASLIAEVQTHKTSRLVVITGGEPFRQSLRLLTDSLIEEGYTVQIETNGTLYQELNYDHITVVCSPKTPNLHPHLWPHINALKYIIQSGHVSYVDGLPTSSLGSGVNVVRPKPELFSGAVFVQPMDELDDGKNKENTKVAIESCLKYGYRLCLQLHKIVGLE